MTPSHQVSLSIPARGAPLRVRDVVDLFLAHGCGQYAPHSLENRVHVLGQLVAALGDLRMDEAKPGHLLIWLDAQPQWRSAWTVRTACQAVQRCFNWSVRMGFIAANPFAGVSVPEGDPRRAMTEAELRALLRNTDALFRRLLLFLRWTGCRPGEAAALEWPMVDWARRVCVLQRHKTAKKTRRPRIIVLTAAASRLLTLMYRHRTWRRQATSRIFVNRRGTPWNRSNLSLRIQRLRRKAGVSPDAKLHGIRHLFGSQAVARGASLKLISQAMGHSSVSITERFYVDLSGEVEAIRGAMEPGR